jgi:hypothetical protein
MAWIYLRQHKSILPTAGFVRGKKNIGQTCLQGQPVTAIRLNKQQICQIGNNRITLSNSTENRKNAAIAHFMVYCCK